MTGPAQIGIGQLGLGSVLRAYQLVVPPNQREYSWTDKEIQTLLTDFTRAITEGNSTYFVGSVVTIAHSQEELEVVDGQQRLATTAILLSAIRDALPESEAELARSVNTDFLRFYDRTRRAQVPRMRLNVDDNDFFRARLNGEEVAPTKVSHGRIDQAFSLAREQIRKAIAPFAKKDQADQLIRWISFIQYEAQVILLRVPSGGDAYKMFETLNDRGLKTSQSDLVKNYLFGRAGDRITEVMLKWSAMRGALETVEDEDITTDFLRHALIAMYGFVREADVFNVVQEKARAQQGVVTFTANIELLANFYVALDNPEHEKWNKYSDAAKRAIETLRLLNIRPLRPLLLAIAVRFEAPEASQAFQSLISWGVRLLIAASTRSGSVEEPVANAANKVYAGDLTDTGALRDFLKSVIPSDEEFREGFERARVSKTQLARYYLRSLESVARGEREPWLIPNNDRQSINLEHVLPRKPGPEWPQFDADSVKLYGTRIGNLALLQVSANSDLRSDSFDSKKTVYAASPYKLTSQIAEYSLWTPTEIAQRQQALADLALTAWPL